MKRILLSSLLLLFAIISFAQRPGKEKIKAQKTAFITAQLDLSSQEAEQFWPVYNKFQKQEKEIRKQHKKKKKGPPNSDAEANEMIQQRLEMETRLLDLKKQKLAGLREVLSPTKIVMLFQAERNFKKRVLKAMRKNKHKNKRKTRG